LSVTEPVPGVWGIAKQLIPDTAFRRDGFSVATSPSAQDDTATTAQGTPVSVNVLANDSDDGTPLPLFITGVGQPKAGSAVASAGQIVYTPNSNFLGEDSFTYTISDGQSTATATVRVEAFFSDGNYWFPFNETSGLTTTAAGGGSTASLIGFTNDPAQWVAGKFNRALQFDGVSNQVVIKGFKGIVGTNSRTVSAWVKTTEASKSIGVVSWGDQPSGDKWSLLVQNTTDPKGTLRLELGFGNTIATTPVNDGQWHHVACTLGSLPAPSSTDVRFYVDGQPDAVIGGAPVAINTVVLNDVLIGNDVQGRFFDGVIDEVRIYNRALSAAEIAAQFSASGQSAAAWYRRYFGNAAVAWTVDDDGDGMNRLAEYAFGGQPLLADPGVGQIAAQIVANHLQLRFHRRLTGTHELVYQCQSSPDLKTWSALAGSDISVTTSTMLAGFEEVVFQADAVVSNQAPFFVRLAVRLP
jgi:hypothetical protein